jgi:hypothetical protein
MPDQLGNYLGFEVSAGRAPYLTACLDKDGLLVSLEALALEEVLRLASADVRAVAINAPLYLPQQADSLRSAELQLRQAGYHPRVTRYLEEDKQPGRVRNSLALAQALQSESKLKPGESLLEVQAELAFGIYAAGNLLSPASYEGRIQRQLALIRQGIRLRDPMSFYEEITRWRLLKGDLSDEMLYSIPALNALAAACLARAASLDPDSLQRFGKKPDGWVWLPVSPSAGAG